MRASTHSVVVIHIGCEKSGGTFFPQSLTQSLTHSLTHSLSYLLTNYSFTSSLTHSLTYILTHSLTHSLTHLPTHSHTHSLTHPPTHSLTHTHTHSLTFSAPSLFPLSGGEPHRVQGRWRAVRSLAREERGTSVGWAGGTVRRGKIRRFARLCLLIELSYVP